MKAWYVQAWVVVSVALLFISSGPQPAVADGPPGDVGAADMWLTFERRLSIADELGNYAPAVAYNSQRGEFLVAWHRLRSDNCHEIVGRRVAEGGAPLGGEFIIASGFFGEQRAYPALAYNATQNDYAVVYLAAGYAGPLVPGQVNEVRGRAVSWNGGTLAPEQLIYQWANRSFWQPRIAWNSTDNLYMVVWHASDTGTGKPTDVASFPLHSDLSPIYGVATLISATREPRQPEVTFNPSMDEFLVVWGETWPVTDDRDVFAARLNRLTGAPVLSPWTVAYSGSDEYAPSVTTNGQSRYLVAWNRLVPGNPDVQGIELAGDGTAVTGYLDIAATDAAEALPRAVARRGPTREYVVTFVRSVGGLFHVAAGYWGDDVPGGGGVTVVANEAPLNRDEPVVAVGSRGFLFSYAGYNPSPGATTPSRIYSRYLWTDARLTFVPVVRR